LRLRAHGYLADVWFQHFDVLQLDSLRSRRLLEPGGCRLGRRRHQLRHDLGEHDGRRPDRQAQDPSLHRLGYERRSPRRRNRLLFHPHRSGNA